MSGAGGDPTVQRGGPNHISLKKKETRARAEA